MPSARDKKAAVRAAILARRRRMTPGARERQAKRICERLLADTPLADARVVAAFAPTSDEVDVFGLLDTLLQMQKTVALPRITAPGQMSFHVFGGRDALQESVFKGFFEPAADAPVVLAPDFDFVLVPAVAVDKKRNRLGYGGGFYDRFLPHVDDAFTCVPAFECQIVDSLPMEKHDCRVDAVCRGGSE